MNESTLQEKNVQCDQPRSHDDPVLPLAFSDVELDDCFWVPRLKIQKERTLPFAFEKTEHAVENLRRCADFLKGRSGELPFPHRFVSSDLYKVMEGAAYLLMLEADPVLEGQMDDIIATIAEAQQDDGYLYVAHSCGVANPEEMGTRPYEFVVHSHELYNVGHMYEGAVAYYRATGKRNWLDIAEKSARHVNRVFFEGDPNYNAGEPVNQAPGHQEIEIGLCKLFAATGEKQYLEMARGFLDIRGVTFKMEPDGKGVMSPEYAQQHRPVAEQERAVGHAVRAGYMYAGMADVGAMTHEDIYDAALDRIWRNLVDTKMHITGGLGAIHGIEGFGPEYDLPNKDAYNETCAAIASVFFNHRMFLHHRDAKYFDVAEVALLNNSLAGVNLAGDRFFYVNPLEADGIRLFNHGNAGRAPWFDCACCPSNIARVMTQVAGYMYAANSTEIYCLLYGGNRTEMQLAEGRVGLVQETNYPFEGEVKLSLSLDAPQEFDLKLRIPTWAQDQFMPGALYRYADDQASEWSVWVNGEPVDVPLKKGFAVVSNVWKNGDQVELSIEMPVRTSECDPRVEANIDRLAITRGPLVYCAEGVDHAGLVQRFVLPSVPHTDAVREIVDGELAGMKALEVSAQELVKGTLRDAQMTLVPYFAWNNRGNASMNVWFPKTAAQAQQAMDAATFDNSKFGRVRVSACAAGDTVDALTDGRRAQSSSDATIPRWSTAGMPDVPQAVTLAFDRAQAVESLGVYWADDGGDVAVPASWNMEFLKDGEWHPFKLYVTDFFGTDKDMVIVVHPAAELICDGLRLNITPAPGKAVGLLDLDLMVK